MDISTPIGFALAIGSVFGGFLIEGGHISAIVQPTAFIIVVGGTIGALFIQFPMPYMLAAASQIARIFMPKQGDMHELVTTIGNLAQKARREGIVALEGDMAQINNYFLRKAMTMAVDGTEAKILRDALEIEIEHLGEHGEFASKVFEAGGGYAPTVGILGAVLGLIHVMENLADPGKLGAGIAVAFVATVYGVFFANVVFLPISAKLKIRHLQDMVYYDMIMTGVLGIVEGENPRAIEQKLKSYIIDQKH
jgi:chemotaxis protein MotA